eukprot:CAMPEP_0179851150 /NCGR_PEP_ID=MMETSP0982-20121206/8097_1 /TAXON_ID=483367 /ORGANISM="non described non described, Strain CCMP 2436" /LENGTH=522 /DNA_ID=CAMNT_0021736651 /DNA_START=34 /DNA_END=1602 /DNA_ORIENTATION=+
MTALGGRRVWSSTLGIGLGRGLGRRLALSTPPAVEAALTASPAGWRPPSRVYEALRWSANQPGIEQRLGPSSGENDTVKFWREAQTITQHEARSQYFLTSADLAPLPHMLNAGLHAHAAETEASSIALYFRMDVMRAALARWGSMDNIARRKQHREIVRKRRQTRRQQFFIGTRLKRDGSSNSKEPPMGQQAVYAALTVNALIAVGKGIAFCYTGSGSMFAETVHSCADFFNQTLLAIGLNRSQQKADPKHPYGYGNEQYVWSMVSGVGIFFLGCGMTTYHAAHSVISPEPLTNIGLGMGTLAIAGLLEGYSMLMALHEIRREAAKSGLTTLDYIQYAPDPLNVGVFLEDAAAVVGVGVAMSALTLAHITGNPAWDAAGSLVIGGMLGGVAYMIISKNREFLIGQSLAPARTHLVLEVLRADLAVLSLHDVKSVMVSPGVARFKAEIHFNSVAICDKYLDLHDNATALGESFRSTGTDAETRRVARRYAQHMYMMFGLEVDRLEALIRQKCPEFKYIDLEPL